MATDEQIRELAYYIWEKEGRPDGKSSEHYFRAKQMLESQESASIDVEMVAQPSANTNRVEFMHHSKSKSTVSRQKRSKKSL